MHILLEEMLLSASMHATPAIANTGQSDHFTYQTQYACNATENLPVLIHCQYRQAHICSHSLLVQLSAPFVSRAG